MPQTAVRPGPPEDRLRLLLDLIVASTEEPTVHGAELARRAYLSRFHFDRLVAAAIGEPPGVFRRRLLLERAAHRLVSGEDPVTDIALASGYGSLEAFSRAFARWYGRPPSEVRRDPPASLRLPAPHGVHFHPPGGLALASTRRSGSMDVLDTMLEHDAWLVGELLDRAATLDDETLDRPIVLSVDGIDKDPTLRGLLARLVFTKRMWTAAIEGRQMPEGGAHDIAGLQAEFAEASGRWLSLVRDKLAHGGADDTFIDVTCDPPHTFSYRGMVSHVLTFSAHRRTMVLGALHDAGITDLGAGDPSGFPEVKAVRTPPRPHYPFDPAAES
jgi:AraC family transcriptional regulator